MNCQTVQHKILSLADPRHVPEALLTHVAECPGCRAWAEQVARLEGLLEQLPVPPAPNDKKSQLIDELTREGATATLLVAPPRSRSTGSGATTLRMFFQRNATLIGGLAAALLLALGAWWSFSGKNGQPNITASTPNHPFLEEMVEFNVALAKADTPAKKLQVIGMGATNISSQARSLSRVVGPEDLQAIARWFDSVVKAELLRQAEKLSPQAMTPKELKDEFGALAAKLGTTATETEKMLNEVSPEAKPALQRIVDTARDGQKKLADLARAKGV
jgi:hypothetical protein